MPDRFDKFSEHAHRALTLAQEEAQRLDHNYIGTEHLVIGVLRVEDSRAVELLARLGVRGEQVRSAVEFIIGQGNRAVLGEIGLTPRAKRVIELAVDESRRAGAAYIGSEHLLVGMVREGEGVAAAVLESLGVTLERVRAAAGLAPGEPLPPMQRTASARFDKFSESARRVLTLSGEEAKALGQPHIGLAHLFLALVRERDAFAGRVLADAGVQLDAARGALRQIAGQGDQIAAGELGLSPEARDLIVAAVEQARRLNHGYIGTEHLLLAVLRSTEDTVRGLLLALELRPDDLSAETRRRLAEVAPASRTSAVFQTQVVGSQVQIPQLEVARRVIEGEAMRAKRAGLSERAERLRHIAADLDEILDRERQSGADAPGSDG